MFSGGGGAEKGCIENEWVKEEVTCYSDYWKIKKKS